MANIKPGLFDGRKSAAFQSRQGDAPVYRELESARDLADPRSILVRLKGYDWSFTDDDTQYSAHDIHPYPAKFIPQIPGTLIAALCLRGELVLDPFGGSGTTALEAVRLGRRALSVDANPLATLIGRVKTTRLTREADEDIRGLSTALKARLTNVPSDADGLCREFVKFIPEIPNLDKWFPRTSCGELALIRAHVEKCESSQARDICFLALSRVVMRVSLQDSETRYTSVVKTIKPGETIARFLAALTSVVAKVAASSAELQYGIAAFHTADAKTIGPDTIPNEAVDLIVTSPPYGNANDYHLYHRFRMFWLGHDPRALGKIEIGSHLRHQKEGTGFDVYLQEMKQCLDVMHRVLKPGRYAALVLGDSIYRGETYNTADNLHGAAVQLGFEAVGTIARKIHRTKRSFAVAGRRAENETILLLRKPARTCSVALLPPAYKMWPYEEAVRMQETKVLLGEPIKSRQAALLVKCDSYQATNARRLAFSTGLSFEGRSEPTWQAILENGFSRDNGSRKDPKYVTHGIHSYKGKFYPQLAKGLMNMAGVTEGATVLDPFCGSGTTLLEGYLNGLEAYGCDMHPLAAKMTQAKVGILQLDPLLVREAAAVVILKILSAPTCFPKKTEEIPDSACGEAFNWFPEPVVYKLNWLLERIRATSDGVLRDFFEIVLSDIIREVSHQDPSDLRIRRRKDALDDADVLGLFRERLERQMKRLERFWATRGYCPSRFHVAKAVQGDSRKPETFVRLGLMKGQIDMLLTSPPYATALPYIDTDRLSLLILFGLSSSDRRPLEEGLTGSREIRLSARKVLDEVIVNQQRDDLPEEVLAFIRKLLVANTRANVGFRRRNLPALLLRFFRDMRAVLQNCRVYLRGSATAMIVVGDSYTMVADERLLIPTTDFVEAIGRHVGFHSSARLEISVTTENRCHMKNAITRNVALHMKAG